MNTTFGAFTFADYQGNATTFAVEWYADTDWTDSFGVRHVAGAPGFGPFYRRDVCTKNGIDIDVPEIDHPTTNDALENANARITAVLRAGREIVATLLDGCVIPKSLAPATTYEAVRIYNSGQTLFWPPTAYLTIDRSIELFNNLFLAAFLGTTLAQLGDVDLSTPPDDRQALVWDAVLGKWIAGEGAFSGDAIYLEAKGAIDNDSTNASAAIQSAFDEAYLDDGGVIEGMDGVLRMGSPIAKAFNGHEGNVTIQNAVLRTQQVAGSHLDLANMPILSFKNVTVLGLTPPAPPATSVATVAVIRAQPTQSLVFDKCSFFGVYAAGSSGMIWTNSFLTMRNCFFGGCGASNARGVITLINDKGADLSDLQFQDYGNYSGEYYAQGQALAWVYADGGANNTGGGSDATNKQSLTLRNFTFDEGARPVYIINRKYVKLENCRANFASGGVYYFKDCKVVHLKDSGTRALGPISEQPIAHFDGCETVILEGVWGENGNEYIELSGAPGTVVVREGCRIPGSATYPDGFKNTTGWTIIDYRKFPEIPYELRTNLNKTGAYAMQPSDRWKMLTNIGAPATVAKSLPPLVDGYEASFFVADSDGIRVVPTGGKSIFDLGSSSNLYIQSAQVGASLTLRAINDEWQVIRKYGAWSLGAPGPILDSITLANVYGAYGVTKLRAAYAGAALRVKDNLGVEEDIGFDGSGVLDVAALSGAAPYVVKVWYDQSGNGNHLNEIAAGEGALLDVAGLSLRFFYDATLGGFRGIDCGDLSAFAAGEIFEKRKLDADPPTLGTGGGGLARLFGNSGFQSYYPLDSGLFYSDFGSNTRKDAIAYPIGSLTAYHVLSEYSAAGDYAMFLNGAQLYQTGSNVVDFSANCYYGRAGFGAGMSGNTKTLILCSAKMSGVDRALIHSQL